MLFLCLTKVAGVASCKPHRSHGYFLTFSTLSQDNHMVRSWPNLLDHKIPLENNSVVADAEPKVAGDDPPHLGVPGSIASQLEDLCSQVDSRHHARRLESH